jgi:hypothetical protein
MVARNPGRRPTISTLSVSACRLGSYGAGGVGGCCEDVTLVSIVVTDESDRYPTYVAVLGVAISDKKYATLSITNAPIFTFFIFKMTNIQAIHELRHNINQFV